MKAIFMAAAVMLLANTGAQAAIDCKSSNLSQADMDMCAGRDFTAADAKLNVLYKTMMAKYDAANQAKLKTAEKAWLTYRDAECDYETNGTAGGTINPMMDTMCRTDKTEARIKELTAQVKCVEGDMSCNAPN